ncbi:hypothetical protein BXZ70DRAFT_88828 [Cristinia sonorae]|uniref:F-box domain-containing protein n=1 Tax=Cristinia sonorae TaxID=1940300 RepID=A0A8K0UPQ6_9AGAR|nr:hypothetical protein BXZ70DRAFT_88828 [Cristinia sonorae]
MVVTLPVVVVDRTIRRLTAMNDRPNSPRSRIHMPLELVDIIIDYLYDDIESLSACSLVARDWRPSTRYHLFRDLRISGDNIFSGYDSFLHFLDKSPAICPFIRTLCLSGIGKPKIASGEQCLIGPYVLVTLLDRLTALHTLTLDQIVWGGVLRRSRKGFWPVKWPPTPRPFGTLRLHRVESHDFGSSQYTKSILQILQAFGAVQKLEVLSVEFDNMPSSDVARLHTPSALAVDHLVMHKVYTSQAFVSGLHNTATTGSLTSLDLQCNSTSDVQSFGTLIRAAGLQLKNLEVDLRRLTRQVATCQFFTSSSHTANI